MKNVWMFRPQLLQMRTSLLTHRIWYDIYSNAVSNTFKRPKLFLYIQIDRYILSEKWKLYTFIIQIANTILNQCISLCLHKLGHLRIKKSFIMHNREITHIVKTYSLSKTRSFNCQLRENHINTKKARVETLKIHSL